MINMPHNFYVADILTPLTDAGKYVVRNGVDFFKGALDLVYKFLGDNPTSTDSKSTFYNAWKVVSNLYDDFAIIGYSLVVLFFLYGFLRDSIDIRKDLQFESIIKLFIRFTLTINVMNLFMTYVPRFCSWAIDLLGVTKNKYKVSFNKDTVNTIANQIGKQYDAATILVGIIIWLVCVVCAVIVIYSCFGRFINFYLLVPFGSVGLSTLAGGGQLSQTGFNYIKSLLVYTFEIVAMGVVLAIAGAFLSGSVIVDQKSGGGWLMFELIVKIITVTAALKGADSTIRKAFGM